MTESSSSSLCVMRKSSVCTSLIERTSQHLLSTALFLFYTFVFMQFRIRSKAKHDWNDSAGQFGQIMVKSHFKSVLILSALLTHADFADCIL